MAKKKLSRFAENLTFPNLFQLVFKDLKAGFVLQGKWHEFFGNTHPIILELGCGKGEYTVNLAEKYPENNYIGIDIKGARLWKGCKTSNEKGMKNVAFIRTHVQLIESFFGPGEVSEIWVTFPDPQPPKAHARRRLTAPNFLEKYHRILKKDGLIHLKTDNDVFFDYTLEVIKEGNHRLLYATHDLYHPDNDGPADAKAIQTFYEAMFRAEGKPICYMEFMY